MTKENEEFDEFAKMIIKTAKTVGIGMIAIVMLFQTFGIIPAGYRGVVYTLGNITGIKTEGLYVKCPFVQGIKKVDVKIQKEQCEVSAASKDLQTVRSVISLNYHIDPQVICQLYREVGEEFKIRLIDPFIQESVKAITAKFTAEELITKREEVKEEMKKLLFSRLSSRGIIPDELNIVDFDFSKNFNDAIEAKVKAEQEALTAKNKLEQVKYEAQQAIAEAQGKAQALKIESQAISANPKIITLRAIEKWNGELPQVTSGAVPFININKSE